MSIVKKVTTLGFIALFSLGVAACAPEVGSPEWCEQMKKKDKGDWSANEATDFAKHCIM
ncbi:MAG: DUF3012 domain-containing protein [Magnetovibrio sp.]|nr:DUF3012 domain-containing protein [Magnetovibrio sp.]